MIMAINKNPDYVENIKMKHKTLFFRISAALLLMLPLVSCSRLSSRSFSKRMTHTQEDWRTSGFHMLGTAPAMPGEQGHLQDLMNRLVEVSPLRGYFVPVMVTANPKINAQTDGRLVYINSGLLRTFGQNEDLLAAVMAHELGHLIGHHAPPGNTRNLFWSAAMPAASINWIAEVSALALREASTMGSRAYNRYEEKEADAIAAVLCVRAGFDPYALASFLDAAGCKSCGISLASVPITNYANPAGAIQGASLFVLRASPYYKTHPPNSERRKTITLMAQTAEGKMTVQDLKSRDASLAVIYQGLAGRLPQTKS